MLLVYQQVTGNKFDNSESFVAVSNSYDKFGATPDVGEFGNVDRSKIFDYPSDRSLTHNFEIWPDEKPAPELATTIHT
ncbi:hypothetical protein TNCV_4653771 [Trichonephila clavipes]|nr:hypothetical protein TNCV_4653771 [Trichonephila clavipes]